MAVCIIVFKALVRGGGGIGLAATRNLMAEKPPLRTEDRCKPKLHCKEPASCCTFCGCRVHVHVSFDIRAVPSGKLACRLFAKSSNVELGGASHSVCIKEWQLLSST